MAYPYLLIRIVPISFEALIIWIDFGVNVSYVILHKFSDHKQVPNPSIPITFSSGQYVIRFTVTSQRTTVDDIVKDWMEIKTTATAVLAEFEESRPRSKVPLA
ncbi:unnamed protein product, partial [Nesidiocoris tenuis]